MGIEISVKNSFKYKGPWCLILNPLAIMQPADLGAISKVAIGSRLTFAQRYAAGSYFVQEIQGIMQKVIK
ncbi:MAG: hypothetical protein NVS1B13_20290 [Flavisolibacter sp.]